jgi:hypothetical protein
MHHHRFIQAAFVIQDIYSIAVNNRGLFWLQMALGVSIVLSYKSIEELTFIFESKIKDLPCDGRTPDHRYKCDRELLT